MGLLNQLFGVSKEVSESIQNGGLIVDVRTPGEFSTGHIDGSINIPLDTIESRLDEIRELEGKLVLCCASGARSGSALSYLKAQGIDCCNGGSWASLKKEASNVNS